MPLVILTIFLGDADGEPEDEGVQARPQEDRARHDPHQAPA